MFLNDVVKTIKKYRMITPGDHVIVGVSGGADSVALLSVLHGLRKKWNITLTVAHLNHMLRGEAAKREACFVAQRAETMGIPCVAEERDVRGVKIKEGGSLQEAARIARYQFFLDVCRRRNAQKIALGHHADDQAETLLMWLIRGTSLKGLAGIPPLRDEIIIRPLITVSRREIEAYLEEKGLTFIPDSSAGEQHYLRNRIRHQLIPLLQQEYNPRIVATLSRLSELLRGENEALELMVGEIAQKILIAQNEQEMRFSIDHLKQCREELWGRIIKNIVAQLTGSSRGIYFRHIEAVCNLAAGTGPEKTVQLPAGWSVVREYNQLIFTGEKSRSISYCYVLDALPERITIEEIKKDICFAVEEVPGSPEEVLIRQKDVDFLDYNTIQFPLTLRNYQPGDRFHPLGLRGSKKLKDFFIDNKIPRRERHTFPVLLSRQEIVWVGGLRIDDRFRVGADTRKVLKVWVA